jgi:tetratricopeptide (TPR) repeat protein
MAIIPASWRSARAGNHRPRDIDPALLDERIASLACWMMLLGTIGFTGALGDYARNCVQFLRFNSTSGYGFWKFLEAINPIITLTSFWPFVLGLALYRTRWRQLLTAAAITFLILSLGGLIDLTTAWNRYRETTLPAGSFRVALADLRRFSPGAVLLVLLGFAQIMAQLVIAVASLKLLFGSSRHAPIIDSPKPVQSRRAQVGRISVYLSLAFLVLTIRVPVWAAYVEVLNHSRFVREYILHNDLDRVRNERGEHRIMSPSPVARLRSLLDNAIHASNDESYSAAKDAYIGLIGTADGMGQTLPESGRGMLILGLNNLAWLLATCPDKTVREPADAVKYATRAVELSDTDGNNWNTLGVARLRNGDFKGSREALMRSISIRGGGDGFDWFYLAILDDKEGKPDSALTLYQQASEWHRRTRPMDPELYEIEQEAAEELKLPKPPRPALPEATRPHARHQSASKYRAPRPNVSKVPGL